jgi:hypothetical protein
MSFFIKQFLLKHMEEKKGVNVGWRECLNKRLLKNVGINYQWYSFFKDFMCKELEVRECV